LQIEDLRRPVFVDAGRLDDPAPGEVKRVEVEGVPVLLANLDGEVYGVRDQCPVDGRSLEGGRLAGPVLVCPWHNCAWDIRTGSRADEEDGPRLSAVPVALHDGAVQVAVNVA
jgi:nitrite reductase/ring-hydroxylating ferredoxin subunit